MRRWRNACLLLMAFAIAAAAWLWLAAPLPERAEQPRAWERQVENAGWARDQLSDIKDLAVLAPDAGGVATLVVADAEGIALVRGTRIRRVHAGISIQGLAFVDAQRGWAVGSGGTILSTIDGGLSWKAQAAGTGADLLAVHFADDAQRGWAVGEEGTILSTTDGGVSWVAQAVGTRAWLQAVHFVDAERGWVVEFGGTMLSTTDGGVSWVAQSIAGLEAVHFVDAQRGWAVGLGGTILSTTDGGLSWTPQAAGTSAGLLAVHFVDAQRGWAVGEEGTILSTTDGGATWAEQAAGTRADLRDVHFVDAQRGWAVGSRGTILSTTDGGVNWTAQAAGTSTGLEAVQFVDAQRGWAVDWRGTILSTTDGGVNWNAQAAGTSARLRAVHFVDSQRGWAVGDEGAILSTTDGGVNWTAQAGDTSTGLEAVHFVDAQRGWAVGWRGTILSTTDGGVRWTAQDEGTRELLRAVHFVDAQRGWAVGSGGTILSTTDGGVNWTAQAAGTSAGLNAVHFVDAQRGWVVGDEGTILSTTDGGVNWTAQAAGTNARLQAVLFVDAQRGLAASWEGTVLSTTDGGLSWTAQAAGTSADLVAVHFVDAERGWAVGARGTILSTTDGGVRWTAQAAPTDTSLQDVHFVDAQRGWAVGSLGTILSSKDGGAHWTAQTSDSDATLMNVHFFDEHRGWAVSRGSTFPSTTDGRILSTTDGGDTWAARTALKDAWLESVHFVNADRGWAVGRKGTILATTNGGATWTAQAALTDAWLLGVYLVDVQRGWAVGSGGTILSTTDGGLSWTAQASDASADLQAVHFADAQRGWAVGSGGTILSTTDGGATWRPRPSPSPAPLRGLSVLDDGRTLWAVGPYTIIKSTDGGETWESVSPMRVELPSGLYWLLGLAGCLLLAAIALSRVPERSERGGEVESDAAISSAKQDRLRAQQQAERLAAFFNHVGTNPPLTLAINGPWGSGKSSLMNLLARELRLDGFRPVWINLWHQQDEAQLYTNLVKAIRADGIAPWWLTSGLLLRLSLALRRAGLWVLLAGATAVVFVFTLHPPRWQDTDTWHAPLMRPWVSFATAAQDAWEAGKARRITVGAPWLDGLSAFHDFDALPAAELAVDKRLAQRRPQASPPWISSSSNTSPDTGSEPKLRRDDLVLATLRPVWGRQFAHLDELLVELHKDSPCSARTRPDSGLGAQLSCPQFQQAIEWLVRAHACKTGMQTCHSNDHRLAGWQTGVASLAHQSTRLSAGPGHEWPAVMGLLLALLAFVPQFRALPGDYRSWYAKLRSSFGGMPEGDPGLRHRFARGLSQLAQHMQRRPLAIFFDDLDRLDGKRTLEFLECLNFLSTDHRAGYYIVGMDYERVVHTLAPVFAEEVKAKYGAADAETLRQSQIRHARRYLHKLVHVVHTLPSANSAEVLAPPDTQAPAQISLRGALRRWRHLRPGKLRRWLHLRPGRLRRWLRLGRGKLQRWLRLRLRKLRRWRHLRPGILRRWLRLRRGKLQRWLHPRLGTLRRRLHQRRGALRRGFEVAGPLLLLATISVFWWQALDHSERAPRPARLAALGPTAQPSTAVATAGNASSPPDSTQGPQPEASEPRSSGFAVPDRSIESALTHHPAWLFAVLPLLLLGLVFIYRFSTRKLQDPERLREAYRRWFELLQIETPRDAKRLANAIRVEAGLSRELLLDEDKEAGQKQIQQTIELVALASLEVLRQRMGERKFRWGSKVRAAADETSKDLESPLQMMGQTERSQAIARVLRYSSLGA